MELEINDGFNIMYAKNCGTPKNVFFKDRRGFVEFILENINDIDFITINDKQINKEKLINDNTLLNRYLKLKRIEDII